MSPVIWAKGDGKKLIQIWDHFTGSKFVNSLMRVIHLNNEPIQTTGFTMHNEIFTPSHIYVKYKQPGPDKPYD